MNHVDADVALELASHEGLVRQTYLDSKGIRTWSIGVTNGSGHNVDRYVGKPQPLDLCLKIFVWLLETKYLPNVLKAFKGRDLTKAQLAAALSFEYNTGSIVDATWVKLWLAGDIKGARSAFMRWNKPAEIIPRRQKERDLFFDGKWSNDGRITEYTRVTSKMTPDWSSGKRIDARAAIQEALRAGSAPLPVKPVDPVLTAPPPVPSATPNQPPPSEAAFSWAGLFAALLSVFKRSAK